METKVEKPCIKLTREGIEELVWDLEHQAVKLYDEKGFVTDDREYFRVTNMIRLLNELCMYFPKE